LFWHKKIREKGGPKGDVDEGKKRNVREPTKRGSSETE